MQSGLWHQINPMFGRGEGFIREAQRLLGSSASKSRLRFSIEFSTIEKRAD